MAKNPTENISVSIDSNLLAIIDHYSCQADLSRSQIFNRAVRLYLASKVCKEPSFWESEYQRLQDEGKILKLNFR